MSLLTPIAVQNADVLRRLHDGAPIGSIAELARELGRDKSNLHKTIKALADNGLLCVGEGFTLSDQGADVLAAIDRAENPEAGGAAIGDYAALRHDQIVADVLNPRKSIDRADLVPLAQDILEHGLLQNLVVRSAGPDGRHRLVAGERRWRAIEVLIHDGDWPADRLIACHVMADLDDAGHALRALVENLQRVDVAPLELADAFQALVDDHGMTTAQIAEQIGRSQRFVQQRLALLKLDATSRQALDEGLITFDQARELTATPKPKPAAWTPSAAHALVLVEIAHKTETENDWRGGCRMQGRLQWPADELQLRGWVRQTFAGDEVRIKLQSEAEAWLRDHDLTVFAARQKASMPHIAIKDLERSGRYHTEILNIIEPAAATPPCPLIPAQAETQDFPESADPPRDSFSDMVRRSAEDDYDSGAPAPVSAGPDADVQAARDKQADVAAVEALSDALLESMALRRTRGERRWDDDGLSNAELADLAVKALSEGDVALAIGRLAGLRVRAGASGVKFEVQLAFGRLGGGSPADALLLFRAGDLVHIGSSATSYRLLGPATAAGHERPAFKCQPVRRGKDYGKPGTITLAAIVGFAGAPVRAS